MEISENIRKYSDLEMSILSCLIIDPTLMKKVRLEDKHFAKHQRLWAFMKSFYKKYHNFDINIMCSVCGNKEDFINYVVELADYELTTGNFDSYQTRLIEMYNQQEEEKWAIQKIYTLSNDLYVGNINIEEFNSKLKKIYKATNSFRKLGE